MRISCHHGIHVQLAKEMCGASLICKAPMNFNFTPTAPMQYGPIGFGPIAPAAPLAPPAPVSPPASNSDFNDSMKKLSNAVELLNKMVVQQTKILEYHENRLDDLEKKYLDWKAGQQPPVKKDQTRAPANSSNPASRTWDGVTEATQPMITTTRPALFRTEK
jgi:hypothetical protein